MEEALLELLSRMERQEAQLLVWGATNIGFDESEYESVCDDVALEFNCDPEVLFTEALDRGFVYEDKYATSSPLYRSRMAETVRLMFALRQAFKFDDLRDGKQLVSDYRFALRPRAYPKRDQNVDDVLDGLKRFKFERPYVEAMLKTLESNVTRHGSSFGLANFQVRATESLLRSARAAESRAHIICAGTGSGKTLSFYLPALARIASDMDSNQQWTKALAIYPRNELLKDQFSETYSVARSLDGILTAKGKPKLRIGAFFGPTPIKGEWVSPRDGWARMARGARCPFIQCPSCGKDLVWLEKDIKRNVERLECSDARCSATIEADEIVLTRDSMAKTPPDIVFTTTEMLNRQMSDSQYSHVFGVGAKRAPSFLLLDEVHTYHGKTGAQVAYLIRRWRHAVGAHVQMVGLSATLLQAQRFMSELCGVDVSKVLHIAPSEEDMEQEGMEYMLVLQNDPTARASLLSTTIQASMLMSRMLDSNRKTISNGTYGEKVFVFGDNLDVINRLYFNLLDAEGWDSYRNRIPTSKRPYGSLAGLRCRGFFASRGVSSSETNALHRDGQFWHMSEKDLGHGLDSKQVGRISSQDSGVNGGDDIVVATASLEVGYNDPKAGAVIQHKAPMEAAQFIQRKGRAGRRRNMRPWTIVVLSSYGRDREAYKNYERLFEPSPYVLT